MPNLFRHPTCKVARTTEIASWLPAEWDAEINSARREGQFFLPLCLLIHQLRKAPCRIGEIGWDQHNGGGIVIDAYFG